MRRALGGAKPDDLDEQLAAFGLYLDGELPNHEDQIEIVEDMKPALDLLSAVATQWRLAPDGRPLALDYAAVRAAADFLGLAPSPKLLADLRWLEAGALDAIDERWGR